MFKNLFSRELTRKRFADRYLKRMARAGFGSGLRFDEKEFRIICPGPSGSDQFINLANAYADARKAPSSQWDVVIDNYVRSLASNPEAKGSEEARPRLMPVVRDAAYFGIVGLMGQVDFPGGDGPVPVSAPLAEGLSVGLVLDSEHSIAMVTAKHLADWGWSFDEALQIAIGNLRERTQTKFKTAGDGLFLSDWHDVYDASRMLLTDLLYRLPLRGDPVVAVPSRNDLLVCGAKDAAALERMGALVAHVMENDTRPSSPGLFLLQEGCWRPYPQKAPAGSALEAARYSRLLHDYQQQKELLERQLEQQGRDVFVATWKLFRLDDTGGHYSLTQWTMGVLTLLPVADQLLLLDMDTREMIIVDWDEAAAILGERLRPLADYAPARVQADGFPSPDQLDALRSVASKILQAEPAD